MSITSSENIESVGAVNNSENNILKKGILDFKVVTKNE